jgi:hypothetical protein
MDRAYEKVVEDAMGLDQPSRGALADKLIVSLAEEPQYLDAWLGECERRLDAYERGEMETIPAAQALAEARRLIRR